jgi:[acyl-carrier-protein] S-malonyltransferase
MVSKTAIIFPGQGAQVVGMGRDFADAHAEAREVFDQANKILGMDLQSICFDGPAERLNQTDISQPAIFTMSVAVWRVLEANGIVADLQPQATAGLSLGEYTALHVAGWMSFEEGLTLVAKRGRLMQDAAVATNGGMVSIMGLDEAQTERLCREAAQGEVLTPANFNCPGQIVISGSSEACRRATELAAKYEARAIPLVVAGAFHSSLMSAALPGLQTALKSTHFRTGQLGVVSNVSADYHGDPEAVRELLRRQVAEPIRWQACIERLIEDGFDRFVEVGPGRVLTGLMRKINRAVATMNFSTAGSLERVSA